MFDTVFLLPDDLAVTKEAAQERYRVGEYRRYAQPGVRLKHCEPDHYRAQVFRIHEMPFSVLAERSPPGCRLVVWDASLLAVSCNVLDRILKGLSEKKVGLFLLHPDMPVDLGNPEFRAYYSLFQALANPAVEALASEKAAKKKHPAVRYPKVSEAQVAEIRRSKRAGWMVKDIAAQFRVSEYMVFKVTKDIKGPNRMADYWRERRRQEALRPVRPRPGLKSLVDSPTCPLSLQLMIARFLSLKKSLRTRTLYGGVIGRLYRFLAESGIPEANYYLVSDTHVASFLASLRLARYSESSIKRYYRYLSSWFGYLVRQGLMEANPVAAVPVPKVSPLAGKSHEYLSPEDVRQILEFAQEELREARAARDEAMAFRAKTICVAFHLLATTGIRAGTLGALTLGDLDLRRQQIRVEVKGGFRDTLGLTEETTRVLSTLVTPYLELPSHYPMFRLHPQARSAFPMEELRRKLREYLAKMGMKTRATLHLFRPSFAVACHLRGMPLSVIRDKLLHADVRTTEAYLRRFNIFAEREKQPKFAVDESLLEESAIPGRVGASSASEAII